MNIVKSNSQADEASIRKALTVDLKNFMAVDINSIGAATCNADVEVVVKRDDGHKVSASAADVLFGIYPAEGGKKMYQVKDFSKLVNLVKDLDAAATGGGSRLRRKTQSLARRKSPPSSKGIRAGASDGSAASPAWFCRRRRAQRRLFCVRMDGVRRMGAKEGGRAGFSLSQSLKF
ncbi:hypothetical protein [Chromobacterium violaceum]|uniref:hypothetical protein n=1 Tax=Chromobacterium violaceum TaxID=536 RepID=UPI0012D41843|nr:hypothetical protein [Chromobacterium violaceum]